MAISFVGEIRMFASNFEPVGWKFCNGQLLAISEAETLFNLIGTTFGGDGQETFAMPDLRGRVPMHKGQGPGLPSTWTQGQTGGTSEVTLSAQQIPVHNHAFLTSTSPATLPNPENAVIGDGAPLAFLRDSPSTDLPNNIVTPVGGSQPHDNMMPTTGINYIISLFGVYPSAS
jgi:microcystin-dependent protein